MSWMAGSSDTGDRVVTAMVGPDIRNLDESVRGREQEFVGDLKDYGNRCLGSERTFNRVFNPVVGDVHSD